MLLFRSSAPALALTIALALSTSTATTGAAGSASGPPPQQQQQQLHPAAAAAGKQVFAHYMLCFAAFGEKGNSSNATAGYQKEMAVAQANGLDGFAIEYLGRDSYYLPSAIGMFTLPTTPEIRQCRTWQATAPKAHVLRAPISRSSAPSSTQRTALARRSMGCGTGAALPPRMPW